MLPARTGDLVCGDVVCIRRMGIPVLIQITEVLTETPFDTGYSGRVIGSEIVPYQVEFFHSDLVPCPGTNMEPVLIDCNFQIDAGFQQRERERRMTQRGHARPLESFRHWRQHDMNLLFRILRNMILLRLQEFHQAEVVDLSWCIRMDTLMMRVDPTVYKELQQRLNEHVLLGSGFVLIYLGVDPTMGDEYIGVILEETEIG